MKPLVSIIMGSTSDWPVMKKAATFFEEMEIPFEVNALSAHRTPEEVENFAKNASENGIPIIPISLKYNKPVGVNKEDKIDPFVWFNYEVEVFIHPIQNNENWEELKQDCLKLVREPLLEKKDN